MVSAYHANVYETLVTHVISVLHGRILTPWSLFAWIVEGIPQRWNWEAKQTCSLSLCVVVIVCCEKEARSKFTLTLFSTMYSNSSSHVAGLFTHVHSGWARATWSLLHKLLTVWPRRCWHFSHASLVFAVTSATTCWVSTIRTVRPITVIPPDLHFRSDRESSSNLNRTQMMNHRVNVPVCNNNIIL